MKPNLEDQAASAEGPWEECFELAVQLALRAGQCWPEAALAPPAGSSFVGGFRLTCPPGLSLQIIRKALSEEKQVSTKTSAADLVTETDHLVEDLIISEMQKRFPSHRFIAEEAAAAGAKCVLTPSPTWIIDPIDGTCNFVHRKALLCLDVATLRSHTQAPKCCVLVRKRQRVLEGKPFCFLRRFPTVAVSIGFAVNQELEFGVIYHCTEERLYTGRGAGAPSAMASGCRSPGRQVGLTRRVSVHFGLRHLSKALVLTEIGPKRDPATLKLFLSNMERLLHAKAHGVRVIGSSTLALCLLASGAADAYYQFGLHCWDLAAATVIIREAGGIVMDTSGGPLDLMSCRVVAAGTREMATLIAQALQTIHYGRDDEK
ncbi:hypothetical protein QTO34_002249 [Cnephaeus nilssonii]|uniref:Inositol-1-monophosphatase n=1 Tax=Cnephaeus nilssonii TaxID=3371016 RepID=A0AA40HUD0_CNENI|nr:hypothetical protein QTO34_002249 [Eptesicus nilssonii]